MVTGLILALAVMATPAPPGPSLRDMVESASLSGVSVSPNERWLVYRQEQASIAENRRRLSWWAAPVDGSRPPRKIADGGEPVWTDAGPAPPETPQWSSDGAWFYFRAVTETGLQVWRADPDRRRVEQVTHDAADVEAYIVAQSGLAWRVGPTREAVQRAERDEYENGVRIDGSVDPAQNLFDAVNVNGRFAAQRLAGQWFARRGVASAVPTFRRADLAGHGVETLSQAAAEAVGLSAADRLPPLFSGLADVSAESRFGHLGLERPRTSDARLTVRQAGAEAPIVCDDRLCRGRISAAGWRPGQPAVIFTRSEPGYLQSLVSWDVARRRVRMIVATGGLIGGGLTDTAPCALTKSQAFCVVAAPETPPRLEAVDLDGGARRVIADPNASLALTSASAPRRLSWKDAAGHAFTGVYFPAEQRLTGPRAPLFLTYYTCEGFVPGGVGEEWPLRALASAGIAALCINKTGSGAAKQDSVADYQIALSGVRAIVDRLDAEGVIDPDRIGMGGLSFGSEATMYVATESDLLKAVSISTPQLEPTYYWIHGVAGRDNHGPFKTAWGLEAPEATPDRWKIVSPALKADRVHAAVLLQMVEQEYRVGPELLARLSNSRTPMEAYVFAQEPHIKVQPRHKLAVYQRNLDWFRFWLQGAEDPDPAKVEQYARWRALRARASAAGS